MPSITLRPITPDDAPFLCALYASTREQELSAVPWSDEQKAAFLRMQFQAQHDYYQQNYRDTAFDIILCEGVPAGRLYVSRWPDDMRIVDIALMPAYRGLGIGSTLLRALQEEAAAAGKPLTIHVERMNPALKLYERLGFTLHTDKGVYLFLEWRASPAEQAAM